MDLETGMGPLRAPSAELLICSQLLMEMNFLDFYKGHKKWSRQNDFCVIMPADEICFEWRFYFYFSNLDLKRSIQYLIDGHPRVCNKVRTQMMGFGWQDHFLLQKKYVIRESAKRGG